MTDKIKTTDQKSDIDFYSLSSQTTATPLTVSLERLKTTHEDELEALTQSNSPTAEEPILNIKNVWSLWSGILFLGAMTFIIVNGYELAQTVILAYQDNFAIGILMGATSLGFISLLGYLIVKEIFGYLRIKELSQSHAYQSITAQENKDKTLSYLKQRAKSQHNSDFAKRLNDNFFHSLQEHHTHQDVLEIYELNVDAPMRREAQKILKNESYRTGGAVLISPNDLIQTLALIWQNLRVVKKISQHYGLRLGLMGNLKLLRMLWENVLLQTATDKVVENLVQDVSNHFLGAITEKVTEATASGVLTARIGMVLIQQLSLKAK